MLDLPVRQIVLNRSGVVPVIGQLEAATVAQHVGMDWKLEAHPLPGPGQDFPDT